VVFRLPIETAKQLGLHANVPPGRWESACDESKTEPLRRLQGLVLSIVARGHERFAGVRPTLARPFVRAADDQRVVLDFHLNLRTKTELVEDGFRDQHALRVPEFANRHFHNLTVITVLCRLWRYVNTVLLHFPA
jgi:hypothetical protein